MSSHVLPELMTAAEVAEWLGVHKRTIVRYADDGLIAGIRLLNGSWRFTHADALALLDRLRVGPSIDGAPELTQSQTHGKADEDPAPGRISVRGRSIRNPRDDRRRGPKADMANAPARAHAQRGGDRALGAGRQPEDGRGFDKAAWLAGVREDMASRDDCTAIDEGAVPGRPGRSHPAGARSPRATGHQPGNAPALVSVSVEEDEARR